jgi:hypothetical protein
MLYTHNGKNIIQQLFHIHFFTLLNFIQKEFPAFNLFLSLLQENFPAVGFDDFRNLTFRNGFHQTMFSVFAAHVVNLQNQYCSRNQDNSNADKGGDADDVHDGKQYEQGNDPTAQVPDILRSQPLELDATVDSFVDLIYTVCHDCIFIGL